MALMEGKMELFKDKSGYPKVNAQENLCGRTHYVDSGTLSWHKSRILSARVVDNGLLFAITTSDALDINNTKRGFRYVIFDIFGTILSRPDLQNAFRRHETCRKAMWAALNEIDAHAHTLVAIEQARVNYLKETNSLRDTVNALKTKFAA